MDPARLSPYGQYGSSATASNLSPHRKYGTPNGYYSHQNNNNTPTQKQSTGGGLTAASSFFQGFGISFSSSSPVPQTDSSSSGTVERHHGSSYTSYTSPLSLSSSTPTRKVSCSPGSPEDIFQSKVEIVLNDPLTFAEFKKRMASDRVSTNAGVIPLLQDFLEDIQLPELKEQENPNTNSASLSPLGLFASFYREDSTPKNSSATPGRHIDQHMQVPELRSATSHSRSSTLDDISIPSITSSVITGMSGVE